MLFVTGNLYERGGGLLCGGHVLNGCPIFSVDKCEERTGFSGELLHGGSLVCDLPRSVSVVGCFIDGLVRADHSCLNVDKGAVKVCRRSVVV